MISDNIRGISRLQFVYEKIFIVEIGIECSRCLLEGLKGIVRELSFAWNAGFFAGSCSRFCAAVSNKDPAKKAKNVLDSWSLSVHHILPPHHIRCPKDLLPPQNRPYILRSFYYLGSGGMTCCRDENEKFQPVLVVCVV